jgi:non-ribosomal peptide synthetase component F
VGTVVSGRYYADLEHIIGLFVNVLAMRNYPTAEKIFIDFLKEVKETTINSFENQGYPFENLVEKTIGNRDRSRNPLYDTDFTLQNFSDQSNELFGVSTTGLNISQPGLLPVGFKKEVSKMDLNLEGYERGEELFFYIEYCTKLFKDETIEKFIQYFKRCISAVIENPGTTIRDIDILSTEEKNEICSEIRKTRGDFQVEFSI